MSVGYFYVSGSGAIWTQSVVIPLCFCGVAVWVFFDYLECVSRSWDALGNVPVVLPHTDGMYSGEDYSGIGVPHKNLVCMAIWKNSS